jgi:hypothetical protein
MVMINHRPMISLRVFAETFDAAVDYDQGRSDISIVLGDRTAFFRPYRTYAWVDNRRCHLDAPVVIIDGETYLPARFLFDTYGLRSDWRDRDTQVIVVNHWNQARFTFALDFGWSRRSHAWDRQYDARDYANYHRPSYHHETYGNHGGWSQHERPSGGNQHGGYSQPSGGSQHGGYGQPSGGSQHSGWSQHHGTTSQHSWTSRPDTGAQHGWTARPQKAQQWEHSRREKSSKEHGRERGNKDGRDR